MSPAFLEMDTKAAEALAQALEIKIPYSLKDNLIGPPITGTGLRLFRTLEGDPTRGMMGYSLNQFGKKVYKIEHTPTGSKVRYRKLNHIKYGECWEAIDDSLDNS